jgi:D-xylose transport system ATP-binding protein
VSEPAVVEVLGAEKHYGGLRALSGVDLHVDAGEVLALVGDNGAGKSTLLKLMSGVEPFDGGTLKVRGEEVAFHSPRDAAGHGIHTVYQDLSLCENLDTVQNLFLGQERVSSVVLGNRLDRGEMEVVARRVLGELAVKIQSLRAPVGWLSGGQRQGIAIGRALVSEPALILLDEPTAALGVEQKAEVYNLINRLRDRGCAVLLISHDLRDVRHLADRVAVLRLGTKVAEFMKADDYDVDDLVASITGAKEAIV